MTESEIRQAAKRARLSDDYFCRKGPSPLLFCPECEADLRDGQIHSCRKDKYVWAGQVEFKWPSRKPEPDLEVRGCLGCSAEFPSFRSNPQGKCPECRVANALVRGQALGKFSSEIEKSFLFPRLDRRGL